MANNLLFQLWLMHDQLLMVWNHIQRRKVEMFPWKSHRRLRQSLIFLITKFDIFSTPEVLTED